MKPKPVAYAAVAADGSESVYVTTIKEAAVAFCRENGWFLLPLYAAPPTWQEEVAAVEEAFERSGVQPTWPADEAGSIGPMAGAMADEIGRLRVAIHSLAERGRHAVCAGRKQDGSVTVTMDATLTDEERDAIGDMIHLIECQHEDYGKEAHTLRNLLERLK